MYITGNQFNLEQRIHELVTGVGDVINYYKEGFSYTGTANSINKTKWVKELNKKYLEGNYGFELGRNFYENIKAPISGIVLLNQTNFGDGQIFNDNYCISDGNNIIYLNDGGTGLRILDITNPLSPIQRSVTGWIDNIRNIGYNSGYLYAVQTTGGLCVYDVTNPNNPQLKNISILTSNDITIDLHPMVFTKNHLYYNGATNGLSDDGYIFVYNITNPLQPSGKFLRYPPNIYNDITGVNGNGGMVAVNNYLYVADYYSTYNSAIERVLPPRILIYDIQSPFSPIFIKEIRVPDNIDDAFEPWQLHYYNGFLYIKDDYITQVYSIKEPLNPIYINNFVGQVDTEGSVISSGILFATINAGKIIEAYSLENASFPQLTNSLSTSLGASHMFSAIDSKALLLGFVGGKFAIFKYQ